MLFRSALGDLAGCLAHLAHRAHDRIDEVGAGGDDEAVSYTHLAELFLAPPPSPEQQARYCALLRRRAGREPLQYLLGFWEFYGRRFHVREGVLIPRPDTELLIDLSLQFFPPGAAPQILDLCSGSGAIAVTLALERPDATVDALELSTDALEVLRENICLLYTSRCV